MKFDYLRLRQARLASKISQEELAFQLETHQYRISFLENGRMQHPSLDLIMKICVVLKLDIKEIIIE